MLHIVDGLQKQDRHEALKSQELKSRQTLPLENYEVEYSLKNQVMHHSVSEKGMAVQLNFPSAEKAHENGAHPESVNHFATARGGGVLPSSDAQVVPRDVLHSELAVGDHIKEDRSECALKAGSSVHQFMSRRDSNRANQRGYSVVATTMTVPTFTPQPVVNAYPFLPSDEDQSARTARLQHILAIQAHGLAQRMRATRAPFLHLGLSGGLDSTLAFLVACQAATILGRQPADVLRTYTMPAAASSDRTQSNAVTLATLYGIANQVIPIGDLVVGQLHALGHDGVSQDITYENVQARLRTSILFNKANQLGGFVLGTGDLSEIALGWCTFNGDHMSHYHVNAGVPKTLVRYLVQQVALTQSNPDVTTVLVDILDTPVSPELTTTQAGEVSQKTEDIIGPYELHDFFLYHLVRWGDRPAKIALLAQQAFGDAYTPAVIAKWLHVFIKRFAGSQFKRSVMPDGPKVGSVALSPRGDWRMPSDLLNAAVWNDA